MHDEDKHNDDDTDADTGDRNAHVVDNAGMKVDNNIDPSSQSKAVTIAAAAAVDNNNDGDDDAFGDATPTMPAAIGVIELQREAHHHALGTPPVCVVPRALDRTYTRWNDQNDDIDKSDRVVACYSLARAICQRASVTRYCSVR